MPFRKRSYRACEDEGRDFLTDVAETDHMGLAGQLQRGIWSLL